MNKRFIYIIMVIMACAICCNPVVEENVKDDIIKRKIHDVAGSALLNISEWQYQNCTQPDTDSRIYSNQVINQELLCRQIAGVLKDNNIEVIPAIRLRLMRPPGLLVVSPRSKIEYFDRVLVSPELTKAQKEEIEKKVDSYNVSSLVVELGGFGAAYPAIVSPDMNTKQIINVSVEEWAHQFLAFRPLGFLYLLDCIGIRQPAGIIIMNETLAGMMADEIGAQVYDRYYKQVATVEKAIHNQFDFKSAMRETRSNTDKLLKAGEIEAAEQYMEKQRLFFEQNGYRIRKLNQAYFAFHGIYGDDPGAVSPVHAELLKLRQDYKTLAGFINDVSSMTGYSQLKLEPSE